MNRALLTSRRSTWGTPQEIYDWLDQLFGFTIDTCADKSNAKHPRYFDQAANALAQSWQGETFFQNQPYGRQIGLFQEKARDAAAFERALGVTVIPARVDTEWWRRFVLQRCPRCDSEARGDERPRGEHDHTAGALQRSRWVHETGVLWLKFSALTVGIYHHHERLVFEGEDNEDGAPFPSAFVMYGHPSRRPRMFSGPPERALTRGWP